MEYFLYPKIPLWPHIDYMAKKLCINSQNQEMKRLKELIGQAEELACPKSVYRPEFIEKRGPDFLEFKGYKLKSKILQSKTQETNRVFAFVASCGNELYDWVYKKTDYVDQYYGQTILEKTLRETILSLQYEIQERFNISQLSQLQPGSLEDWPIQEQGTIFNLLENGSKQIGVSLTSSLLMIPPQSLSGLFFHTQEPFVSCQLCPIKDCPDRQALYQGKI